MVSEESSQYELTSKLYLVELEGGGELISVKPENLLQHVCVTIHGIQSDPALNDQSGTVITWSPNTGRYNVYIAQMRKVVSIKSSNIILASGTVARLDGITSSPEVNGKWGTIKNWVSESNKYDVQLSPARILRVQADNVAL